MNDETYECFCGRQATINVMCPCGRTKHNVPLYECPHCNWVGVAKDWGFTGDEDDYGTCGGCFEEYFRTQLEKEDDTYCKLCRSYDCDGYCDCPN